MKEKILCVEWDDAAYNSGYYDKKDTTGDFEPAFTRSVGHLIKRDKKAILLSTDRFYDSGNKITNNRHISIIPRKMIRRILEVK